MGVYVLNYLFAFWVHCLNIHPFLICSYFHFIHLKKNSLYVLLFIYSVRVKAYLTVEWILMVIMVMVCMYEYEC